MKSINRLKIESGIFSLVLMLLIVLNIISLNIINILINIFSLITLSIIFFNFIYTRSYLETIESIEKEIIKNPGKSIKGKLIIEMLHGNVKTKMKSKDMIKEIADFFME